LCVKLLQLNVGAVGAAVSKTIVSDTSAVVFPKLSLHLIYTVFVPSHPLNVCAIDVLQLVQFVAHVVLPNATCTHHTHPSVAHVVFNVTDVLFVATALLLIVNVHQVGTALSILICADVLIASWFHAVSVVRYLTY
jgi:hypothetical protein